MVEEDIEYTTLDDDTITKSDIRDEIQEMYLDANKEGYTQIQQIFLETAENEKEHAKIWLSILK